MCGQVVCVCVCRRKRDSVGAEREREFCSPRQKWKFTCPLGLTSWHPWDALDAPCARTWRAGIMKVAWVPLALFIIQQLHIHTRHLSDSAFSFVLNMYTRSLHGKSWNYHRTTTASSDAEKKDMLGLIAIVKIYLSLLILIYQIHLDLFYNATNPCECSVWISSVVLKCYVVVSKISHDVQVTPS